MTGEVMEVTEVLRSRSKVDRNGFDGSAKVKIP
jgi:hypothetical protein